MNSPRAPELADELLAALVALVDLIETSRPNAEQTQIARDIIAKAIAACPPPNPISSLGSREVTQEVKGPVVQTLAAFAKERGLTTEFDVLGHIHAGLRSAPTTKTYARWNEQTLARLQSEASATSAAYRAAIEAGVIAPPPKATMEEIAAGDPDRESTKAAQRVIEKRRARAASPQVSA